MFSLPALSFFFEFVFEFKKGLAFVCKAFIFPCTSFVILFFVSRFVSFFFSAQKKHGKYTQRETNHRSFPVLSVSLWFSPLCCFGPFCVVCRSPPFCCKKEQPACFNHFQKLRLKELLVLPHLHMLLNLVTNVLFCSVIGLSHNVFCSTNLKISEYTPLCRENGLII